MLRLYDYWRSSAAYRVRIGMNLKGLCYEAVSINLDPSHSEQTKPDYLSKNPQGRVPYLETGGGALGQSLAILEWLDETHPEPAFLPGSAWERAQLRAFALTIACDIHPLNNVSVLAHLREQFGAGNDAIKSWYAHWIQKAFAALETQIAAKPETGFLFGAAPTLPDIVLVPQCANARRFKVELNAFPRLRAVDERARQHPAFAKAAPENQEDAIKE